MKNFYSTSHKTKPQRVLDSIIIMLERRTCIVGWINKDALDLACEFLFKGFESEEIVPKNEAIIENVVVSHFMLGVIRLLDVFQQDARLQLRPMLLTNPGQF